MGSSQGGREVLVRADGKQSGREGGVGQGGREVLVRADGKHSGFDRYWRRKLLAI
jgi:hypothetical protein